jgi:hypothetical protein
MTFNRSNSLWYSFGGGYLPDEDKIGSDNSVGTINQKVYLSINNQTNKDYYLYFDLSSSSSSNFEYYINGLPTVTYTRFTTLFRTFYIPAYSNTEHFSNSTSVSLYLDAWYLKDLGVSDSYDAGYDVGEADGYADGLSNNPNILINAAESLIGMFVNFTFIIFTLEIFGVSILTVVGVLFGIVAITWILKTIRG